jgi:hypothetical protein
MPIKFKCPHCKRGLSVKEHLAGKRAACPACKKVLQIPTPQARSAPQAKPAPQTKPAPQPKPAPQAKAAAPPPDLEALAASVLGDEAKPTEDAEPKTVDFNCPQCDAELHVSAEFAGKQTPCPECRRIIKVPQLVKKDPKDWRKAGPALPSGARQNVEQPAPEGAWGSATSTSTVSRQALVEADAIPAARERLTLAQKLKRLAATVAVAGVLAGVGWWGWNWWASNADARAIALVVSTAGKNGNTLGPVALAELHRGAGEYYLRTNRRQCIDKANEELQTARGTAGPATGEHDALLIDLALTQVECGGSNDEALTHTRLTWNDTGREIQRTLQQIGNPDGRLAAIRAVGRKLVERGHPEMAVQLASVACPTPADLPEAQALAGLELLRADRKLAEKVAGQAIAGLPPPKEGNPADQPVAPALIALCVAVDNANGNRNLVARLPAHAQGPDQALATDVRLGWIDGLGRLGKAPLARQVIGQFPATSPVRVQALVVLAAGLLEQDQTADARSAADDAVGLALNGLQPSPWVILRLVQVGAQADLDEARLADLAKTVEDPGMRSRIQLELLRARLARSNERATEDRVNLVEKQTSAHVLAWEAVARHNARMDAGTLGTVYKWEEPYRTFGLLGAVLGRQDPR